MGFFDFLGTTLSGGGESYSKAVSSELANYRERGMQPYDRSIKRDEAISSALGIDQRRKLIDANERLINTAGDTMPSAISFAGTRGIDPRAVVNPPAQPMPTAPVAPVTSPQPVARGRTAEDLETQADKSAAPTAGANTTLDAINEAIRLRGGSAVVSLEGMETALKNIAAQITKIENDPKRGIMDPELTRLRREQQQLYNGYKKAQQRQKKAPTVSARTTTPAPAASTSAVPLAAQVGDGVTDMRTSAYAGPEIVPDMGGIRPPAVNVAAPTTAINLPSAAPTGVAGPQVPAPQGAWVNAAPVITQYASNIAAAAQVAGVSPEYLVTLAGVESTFDPNAANPRSSARGLYQFIDSTAKEYGLTDPTDPVQAIRAVGEFTRDNRARLTKALGRPPNDRELYLAHQQGTTGAAELLSESSKLAKDIVGTDEVIKNAGNLSMTGQEFAEHVMRMQDRKAASLGMTPVEALQMGAGNVGLKTQDYIDDPNRVSLDLQITNYYQQQQQSMFDLVDSELTYAQQNAADLARTMGPMQYRQYVNGLRKQQMDVNLAAVQSRTTGAVLYAYQGLNLAQGGQTGLLNLALTEITGAQTEIIPRNSQDGTPLFYSLAIAGRPVGEPMPYDQLVQEVRTRIDRGYAEAVAAAQAEANMELQQTLLEQSGAIRLETLKAELGVQRDVIAQAAQARREVAVAAFEAEVKGGKWLDAGKDATGNQLLEERGTGKLFIPSLQSNKVNGKTVDTYVLEPVYGQALS